MKGALVATALVITATALSAAAAVQSLPQPKDAALVGTTAVTEIREFPEEAQTKAGPRAVEEAQGVQGSDQLFETHGTYGATVAFFDHSLKGQQFTVDRRTAGKTSTVWSLKRPDGSVARLAVRNTNPTTFEWVTVTSEASPVKR
jgi:hypothetical protein